MMIKIKIKPNFKIKGKIMEQERILINLDQNKKIINKKKIVFAGKLFLELLGFNAVMRVNVEDPIGIICSVLALTQSKLIKSKKKISFVTHAKDSKTRKLMVKVKVNYKRKLKNDCLKLLIFL